MATVHPRRAQELFLDGIDYSIRMAEYAYERLREHAAQYAPEQAETVIMEKLFLDAWSVVDCGKRLRALVEQTPGMKKTPARTSFLKAMEPIVDFRNYYQHLESQPMDVASTGWPIWGTLSWVIVVEPAVAGKGRLLATKTAIPGRLATVTLPMISPVGRQIEEPAGFFVLSMADRSINLSDLIGWIRVFHGRYKAAVIKATASCAAGDDPIPIIIDASP